jgi:hypothetical protein
MQYEAWQNGDKVAYMKTLSKQALETLHRTAPKYGDGDELLGLYMKTKPYPYASDTRNEKITGDVATLQAKDRNGEWQDLSFVKEGDEWKFVSPTWIR